MNPDNVMSWALSGLGGAIELLTKQVEARDQINVEQVQRLEAYSEQIQELHKVALDKM